MAINNSSLCFSLNMLKTLLNIKLLTEDEYKKISKISTDYYQKMCSNY